MGERTRFGEIIRMLRLDRGLNKRALAKLVPCDPKTIGNIEKKAVTPMDVQDTNLWGLARAFEMTEDQLLGVWRTGSIPASFRKAESDNLRFGRLQEIAAGNGLIPFRDAEWYFSELIRRGIESRPFGTIRRAAKGRGESPE